MSAAEELRRAARTPGTGRPRASGDPAGTDWTHRAAPFDGPDDVTPDSGLAFLPGGRFDGLPAELPDAGPGAMRRVMRVAALDRGQVYLEAERASGCASCGAREGCGAGALAEMTSGRQYLCLPRAGLALRVGDEVVVAMDDRAFLGAATRAYLLPALALLGVAVLSLSLGLSDGATALLCLPALGLSTLPLLRADRRERSRPALRIEGLASAATPPDVCR